MVQIFCSSGRTWELGVPSELYDSVLGLWLVARVYLSLSYPSGTLNSYKRLFLSTELSFAEITNEKFSGWIQRLLSWH